MQYNMNTWDWQAMDLKIFNAWETKEDVFDEVFRACVFSGNKLLDLGTGLGRIARFFAKNGFKVSALDVDAVPLAHARQTAAANGLNIDFRQGNMMKMPFVNKSFNCVYAANILSLTHMVGLVNTLDEVHRVLTPGGIVYGQLYDVAGRAKHISVGEIDEHSFLSRVQYGNHFAPFLFVKKDEIPGLLRGFSAKIIPEGEIYHFVARKNGRRR